LGDKPDAGDGRYIHFLALGEPGQVTINSPCLEDGARWMVYLRAAHHVILQGFNLEGAATPGDRGAKGPWAGIMLDGDFGRTGALAHHIVIVGNFSHNHVNWGLHSTDTRSVLLQDNVFALSAREHSAYVSDGSDDYVIRRNIFFGSHQSGLQCNLDPEASLREVMKHEALQGAPRFAPSRAWAEHVLDLATARFGEHGFPDGRGVGFIIEDNVINQNGRGGGGALNLAGLAGSLIQNNLIYGNLNHGIAEWDNMNPFDAASVASPPATAEQASSTALLPRWGCHDNLIRNNTVLLANPRRAAVLLVNGSYRNRLRNNVLINDADASMDIDGSSLLGLDAGYSATNTVRYRSAPFDQPSVAPFPDGVRAVAVSLLEVNHTITGVTQQRIAAELMDSSDEPWILVNGASWRLNPKRPDFRPRPGSALLAGRADPSELPPLDLSGRARRTADIGAFGAAEGSPDAKPSPGN
ncbi:MAG: right-handed parallel beta-helix repeat-containing protein, partial [Byssovorax sp.]